VQQVKVLKKATLAQNHKGTYYVEFTEGKTTVKAYLPKKKVEEKQHFYSPLVVGKTYLASIDKVSDSLTLADQLMAVAADHDDPNMLALTYACRLLSDGRVALQGQQDQQQLCLCSDIVKPFKHRIFHNSRVAVSISHNDSGFYIKQWRTQEPANLESGVLERITALSTGQNPQYAARYYIAKKTYLPVTFWPNVYERCGVKQITQSASVPASVTFDDAKRSAQITLSLPPELLVKKYSTPHAQLTYLGPKTISAAATVYQFETQLIDGMSLSVSAWQSDLKYCVEDISALQIGQSIVTPIIADKKKDGWCNFKPSIATKNDYNEQFRCIVMKNVGHNSFALLETVSAPHERVLIARTQLIKYGLYAIKPQAVLQIEITRSSESADWQVVQMECNAFAWIQQAMIDTISCRVLKNWRRYDNNPDYLTKMERSRKNYAFANHCIATVEVDHMQLLVLIPVPVLASQGFNSLSADQVLKVSLKKITTPLFEDTARPILCVDQVLEAQEHAAVVADGRYVDALFIETLPVHKNGKSKYRFSIVGRDDTADFIDWGNRLRHIADPEKYCYRLCVTQLNRRLYVQELISASLI